MNELKQIDIKIFAEEGENIAPYEFVPVLQRWIQEHRVPGVLIDVADYSHIHHGAGMILVAHEYNLSIDYTGGRMGLLIHYKLPPQDTFEDRLGAALKQAFSAAAILEEEPEFQARLKFSRTQFQFLASDRLLAPNTDEAYNRIAAVLEARIRKLTDGDVILTRMNEDPRDRLAIEVTASAAVSVCAAA